MDISTLQQRLRQFAAERDWQPYQTPEEPRDGHDGGSRRAAGNLPVADARAVAERSSDDQRRHLGEELSDVLLYLVQIADHGGVDLDAAVERKLALNALSSTRRSPGH